MRSDKGIGVIVTLTHSKVKYRHNEREQISSPFKLLLPHTKAGVTSITHNKSLQRMRFVDVSFDSAIRSSLPTLPTKLPESISWRVIKMVLLFFIE